MRLTHQLHHSSNKNISLILFVSHKSSCSAKCRLTQQESTGTKILKIHSAKILSSNESSTNLALGFLPFLFSFNYSFTCPMNLPFGTTFGKLSQQVVVHPPELSKIQILHSRLASHKLTQQLCMIMQSQI